MKDKLAKGKIYESTTHGDVEYLGVDEYYGERTYKFRSITYGGVVYWKPEKLGDHLDLTGDKETRADLCVSVLSDFSDSALSDGVVGEMVGLAKKTAKRGDWLYIEAEAILAKLEGNDG